MSQNIRVSINPSKESPYERHHHAIDMHGMKFRPPLKYSSPDLNELSLTSHAAASENHGANAAKPRS